MRIETLKEKITNITEPRRTGFGNIRHKLEDIVIIGLCTVIICVEKILSKWKSSAKREIDAARARKDNSPLNMNVLRKTALSLLNKAIYGRVSKRIIRFRAAMTPHIMLNVLFDWKK